MLGDVNFDGKIDGIDATLTLRDYTLKISGMPTIFSKSQQESANANSDEAIDGVDATLILRYYTLVLSGDNRTFEEFLLSGQ